MARTKVSKKGPVGSDHKHHIKKPHRWHAGTVALRQCRRLQKSTDLLMPRIQFRRLIDQCVLEENDDNLQKEPSAVVLLHESAEAFLIDRFNCTKPILKRKKAIKITGKDIKAMCAVRNEFLDDVLTPRPTVEYETGRGKRNVAIAPDAIDGIYTASLKWLFRKAGFKNVAKDAIEVARVLLLAWTRKVVRDAAIIAKGAGKKTLRKQDVKLALQRNKYTIYG